MYSAFNNAMFSLARQRLMISQTELSKLSGISQAVISKIESGLAVPNPEQLARFTEVLQVKESFFHIQSQDYGSLMPLYRKRSTISQKEIAKASSISSIIIAHVSMMLKMVDMQNVCSIPFLEPNSYMNGAIDVARAARQFLGIPKGPIDNITSIMENNGIMVFLSKDFNTKIDGFTIYPNAFDFPYTFVNSDCSGERLRMTLAHELGHIFMHKFDYQDCENEAWDFAGEFLMPEDEFVQDLPSKITNLRALLPLKYKWKVSLGAIAQRLKKLEIISERTFRYLRIQLSQYGKNEPYPIPQEAPELCKSLIEYCMNKLRYSRQDLENITGFSWDEFAHYYLGKPVRPSLNLVR